MPAIRKIPRKREKKKPRKQSSLKPGQKVRIRYEGRTVRATVVGQSKRKKRGSRNEVKVKIISRYEKKPSKDELRKVEARRYRIEKLISLNFLRTLTVTEQRDLDHLLNEQRHPQDFGVVTMRKLMTVPAENISIQEKRKRAYRLISQLERRKARQKTLRALAQREKKATGKLSKQTRLKLRAERIRL